MEGKSFLSPKREKTHTARSQPLLPLWVAPAHVKFRILCLVSRAGAVIGYCGNVINQIKQSTRSKIRVEEAPLGSPEQVVTVIANGDSRSRVKLGGAGYGEGEEVEVSRAQEALIRVFEALIDGFGTGTVSCRLLMEASHVGAVKGEMVEMIMKETRCTVQIGTDNLPICADPDDALVEIEGNVLAVKKALVSVSSRLQACQQICKTRMVQREALYRSSDVLQGEVSRQHREVDPRDPLDRHFEIWQREALDRPLEPFPSDGYQRRIETTTQETLSQPRIDFHSRRSGSVLDTHPHSITASASKKHPVTIRQPLSGPDDDIRNIVFKILCPTESAGGFIGPGGTNIKNLQSETGASIDVGDTPSNCDECLITITSEIPDDRLSPAQRAIVLVFTRLYEIYTKRILESGSRTSTTARLVVPTFQVGWLLEASHQMWTGRDVSIQVLEVGKNPKCISANEHVVQISGEFPNVKGVIYTLTSFLRAMGIARGETANPGSMGFNPSSSDSFTISTRLPRRSEDSFQRGSHNPVNYSKPVDVDPYHIRPEDPFPNSFSPTSGYPPNFVQGSTTDVDHLCSLLSEDPSQLWGSPPPAAPRGAYDGSGGLSSTMDDPVSGHISSVVTNITVETRVPENAVSFVCGREVDGHYRLDHMRQISGATVIVHEPQVGTSYMIIAVSGTPDQIQIALKLLHAFIRIGESLSLLKRLNLPKHGFLGSLFTLFYSLLPTSN